MGFRQTPRRVRRVPQTPVTLPPVASVEKPPTQPLHGRRCNGICVHAIATRAVPPRTWRRQSTAEHRERVGSRATHHSLESSPFLPLAAPISPVSYRASQYANEPYTDASPPLPSSRLTCSSESEEAAEEEAEEEEERPSPPSARLRASAFACSFTSNAASLDMPAVRLDSTLDSTDGRVGSDRVGECAFLRTYRAACTAVAVAVHAWRAEPRGAEQQHWCLLGLHNHGERCRARVLRLTTPTRAAGAWPHPLLAFARKFGAVGNADDAAPGAGLIGAHP